MNKNVLTIFLLDKTIAFLVIEPLNNSVCQSTNLLFLLRLIDIAPNFRPSLWQRKQSFEARPTCVYEQSIIDATLIQGFGKNQVKKSYLLKT